MAEQARTKDRAHTIYKLKDGTRVPGCTTITGVMDKSMFLVPWANKLGLQGIDSKTYVDGLADAGTLAHYLAACDLMGIKPDQAYLDEFSKVDMDRAENSLLKFFDWRKEHQVELLGSEMQLVSEHYRFGGTCDVYAVIDGALTLLDIKTCKAIYGQDDEKYTQLAGYEILLEENGYKVEDARILRIGRDETEGFEYLKSYRRDQHRKRFFICRELYEVNKALRRKNV